jgi:transposase InsO family protein
MRDLAILLIHLIATLVRLLSRGGARSVVAESVLLKHQLLVLNRSRRRAPTLRPMDRIVAGLCATGISPLRLARCAVVLKPSTIIGFHQKLVKRKYRLLFAPKRGRRSGPKGPSPELIAAIVGMKHKNRKFGCRRIAQQLSYIFGIDINKDVVRRVLAAHYRPKRGSQGPSWLSFLGHTKDSLWSVDLFRCESLFLKSHWAMVVMHQFTRRIIGFAVHVGNVDGPAVCRMFNEIIAGQDALPFHLSSDHDPLFEFRQWQANLRILEVTEMKTVPYVPLAHPFVERLIGTIRRELLDHVLYWTAGDLEQKLTRFQKYYNRHRIHSSLAGVTPDSKAEMPTSPVANRNNYRWRSDCRDLYQLPAAA